MKRTLAPLAAAGLVACAHAPASPAPADPGDPPPPPVQTVSAPPTAAQARAAEVERLREDVEALLAAQGEATWNAWTAGAPLDLEATYRGREWIADGRGLAVAEAWDGPAAEVPRRAALRAVLLGETLTAAAGAPGSDGGDPTFPLDGRAVPLRDATARLAAEPDAARRAAIDAARAPAAAQAARASDARADALSAAAARLGRGDLRAVATSLRGRPVEELAALARATLDATRPAYCAAMEDLARRELKKPLASTGLRDLPRLLRAAHEPGAHPASRLVADGHAAAAAVGVDLASRVRLDDAVRAGKSQRPLAVPVRVPGDVRLSALPSGGTAEARAFLHERGVAIFVSGIRAGAMEDRRLGSPAIPETWGYLLEGLAADPAWLQERSRLSDHALAREVRVAQAERLHAVRWQAATLLRELERGTPAGREGDAPWLSRALCRNVTAEEAARWPLPRDPLLRSADGLRAALLAAQLESALAARGTAPWWRQAGTGPWLAGLWAGGSALGPEDLARAAGLPGIDPAPLAQLARARFEAAGW